MGNDFQRAFPRTTKEAISIRKPQHRPPYLAAAILLALCVVLLSIVHFGFTGYISAQIDARVFQRIKAFAADQRSYIASMLDARFNLLESFASMLGREKDEDLGDTFDRFCSSIEAVSDYHALMLLDTQGNYRTSDGKSGSQSALAGRIAATASSQPLFIMPRSVYRSNETTVLLSAPVTDIHGEPLGVLCASYPAQFFGRQLLQETYRDDSFSLLTDAEGNLLFSASQDGIFVPSSTSSEDKLTVPSPMFFDEATAAAIRTSMACREHALYTFSHDDVDYALVQTPLTQSDWIFFCMLPIEPVAADFDFISRLQFWQMFATVTLVASFSFITISILLRDKRRLKQENSILSLRVQTDSMTGLLNHATTRAMIADVLEQNRGGVLLLLLDLDNLKAINDTHGHPIGDHAILIFASLLRRMFGQAEVIGRIGGDEFMICQRCPPCREQAEEQIRELQSELCRKLSGIASLPDGVVLHCSVGAAYSEPDDDYDSLYRRADDALYQVKRNGKDGYHFG